MKKILFFFVVVYSAISCNNHVKSDEQEARERDSADQIQEAINQRFVDSLEKADLEKMHQSQSPDSVGQ